MRRAGVSDSSPRPPGVALRVARRRPGRARHPAKLPARPPRGVPANAPPTTLHHFTARTITDPDAYLAAIEGAARSGVGVDREEYLTGVNAIAAAIHGLDGQLLALVWIAGFSAYFTDEAMARAGEALRRETRAISKALGADY